MFNNPFGMYSPQANIDKINTQINELEKMKTQMQQPTPITQNFQIAPTNRDTIKYAGSIEEVQKDMIIGDTPYFSKDMSIVWIKNAKGEIKTYELTEIIAKDDKDIQIDLLIAQVKELKGMIENAKSSNEYVNEPVEDEESTNVSVYKSSTKKQK